MSTLDRIDGMLKDQTDAELADAVAVWKSLHRLYKRPGFNAAFAAMHALLMDPRFCRDRDKWFRNSVDHEQLLRRLARRCGPAGETMDAKSAEGAKGEEADTDGTDSTDLGQDIRLALNMAQKAKALKANMECRNGGEVCTLGSCTGTVCPVDSCDLEDGIRSMPESVESVQSVSPISNSTPN